MDKISKLYYLEKIHKDEENITLNEKEILNNKHKLNKNKKRLRKIELDICRNLLLFAISTGSIGLLTYCGVYVNNEIEKTYVKEDDLSIASDQILDIKEEESEDSILSKIIRFIVITTLVIFNDLAIETIMYSIGLNKDDYLGFIAAFINIKEDTLRIEELKKNNKDIKIETKKLLDKTKKLINEYHVLLYKLESEKLILRKK